MFNLQVTSTTMELLPLVCLCLLTRSGTTFAEEGSKVIRVEEDSDVTLPCSLSTKEDIELKLFDWKKDGQKEVFLYDAGDHYNNGRAGQDEQFKGRVSHFPDELKHGDASIKIRNTRVADSGDYTCDFPRLQPSQIFHIRLVVGSKVIRVEEDSDVTLPCSLSSKEDIEFKLFDWKKDGHKEVFLYEAGDHYNNGRAGQDQQFKGRVSHFPDRLEHGDASIKIRNTRVTDSGVYTCAFPRLQPSQIFHIQLVVGSKVIRVEEDSDVTLPCSLSTKEDIELKLFDWKKDGQKEVFLYDAGNHYNNVRAGQDEQFKGRVSHFPDELKHGDASIIIRNTRVTDSGDYTCAFPRLEPSQIFHIRLVVDPILKDRSGENIPGAAAKPDITVLKIKDGTLLVCVVLDAFPKPNVEWQDRAGNILPAEETQVSRRGGSYNIILNTTVTKTDIYRCVATQEDIYHQTDATIDVDMSDPILKDRSGANIPGAAPKPYITILRTNDGALLQCKVQDASPKPKVEWQDRAGNILPAEETQASERGGRYNIILQTTVTKADHYRCVATQEDISHQTDAETYVYISGSSTGWVVAVSVLCALLVGGVVLLSWCYSRCRSTQNAQKGSPQETSVPLKEGSHT